MLISFIIPTFNREKYVLRAIKSIISQKENFSFKFEIIVIDDGSTDNTLNLISESAYKTEIKLISLDKNSGLGKARNLGIASARGKWCALLDSDNALLPNCADKLEKILLKLDDSIGVFWGGCIDSDGKATIQHQSFGKLPGIEVLINPPKGEHFSLIRTDIALDNLYPSLGTKHACEPGFWATISSKTSFYITSETFQFYEKNSNDRFCSVQNRISGAGDLVKCYAYTASVVKNLDPKYYWILMGKSVFYDSVDGNWFNSIKNSLQLFPSFIHYSRVNILIFITVLFGPLASRMLLKISQMSINAKV
jgi:glycosyltransferase involved in cell wall biosynthesis